MRQRTLNATMQIGVVASMKKGLEHFIYRELMFFTAQGCKISLFPTKHSRGLYNPDPRWSTYLWNPLLVLLLQPIFFLRQPSLYLRLLIEAIQTRSVQDLFLAWYFSPHMATVDVIYATFGDRKLFVAYFCKRIVQKPLAVTLHAYELYRNPNPRLFPRALAACDQIITVTEYNRELLEQRYHIPSSRVALVRYSVDVDDYQPSQKFIILIVGFFVERKGHEILFKAIKQLNQDDLEVWVVGDIGVERPVDVRGLARDLGVESQVAFFGKLQGNALKALYQACDVFCLPCRTEHNGVAEGFPNVLIEAMAFGKPVITSRHVEIPRIITEVLVDENDVEGLAAAIQTVYQSAELRRRLGEQNRRIAVETFSPSNAGRTVSILQGLSERQGAAGSPALSGTTLHSS